MNKMGCDLIVNSVTLVCLVAAVNTSISWVDTEEPHDTLEPRGSRAKRFLLEPVHLLFQLLDLKLFFLFTWLSLKYIY